MPKRSAANQAIINGKQYDLSCDRKIIYDLSLSNKYKNNKGLLIKHASRTTGRANFCTLGLSQPRKKKFVNKWFNVESKEKIQEKGISFWEQTDRKGKVGRKRIFSVDQMWKLFIHYFTTIAGVDMGMWRYARSVCVALKISRDTVVRYLKLFTIAYKRKVQPHELTDKNKERRLSHCKYWDKLGEDYYYCELATCDETTVYTNDILTPIYGRMPLLDLTNYKDFEDFAKRFHFLPNNNNDENNNINVNNNPTINISSWTVPPVPLRLVCNLFIFYLFQTSLFILWACGVNGKH